MEYAMGAVVLTIAIFVMVIHHLALNALLMIAREYAKAQQKLTHVVSVVVSEPPVHKIIAVMASWIVLVSVMDPMLKMCAVRVMGLC
jgi:hypothetical protein